LDPTDTVGERNARHPPAPNGKLIPVNVTLSVKDDYDPAPEIETVTVPHGEGK